MKQLENKWLLLDTNVLIEQFLGPKNDFWDSFSEKIKSLNCKTIITPEIQFELFRRIQSEHDKASLLKALKNSGIEIVTLPNQHAWQMATRIGQLYSLHKLDGKGPIDCLLASYLQQYGDRLYLATFNNKDFPSKLFDREFILNFEKEDEIKVLGIYKYSPEKFTLMEENFKKSKAKKS